MFEHLSCFQFSTISNYAVVNIVACYLLVCTTGSSSSAELPKFLPDTTIKMNSDSVSVQVCWEAGAKIELDVQEIYIGKCSWRIKEEGIEWGRDSLSLSMSVWHLWTKRTKGRLDWKSIRHSPVLSKQPLGWWGHLDHRLLVEGARCQVGMSWLSYHCAVLGCGLKTAGKSMNPKRCSWGCQSTKLPA